MTNKEKYYVTMTDTFLSGWGHAQGKINKLIFVCESFKEAEVVEDNARRRGDMKYINITRTKPYYAPGRYFAQFKTKGEYPAWYKESHFK